ncbi:hypothetical protein AMS68_007491 [Peltaster fructicola]|uniref:Aminotransferase class V domain-containing protein n=1 Tax=Peltaster fructicola TaxID=286661 RepID=A0A6H0Y4N3_9PEZI|nr:hypothetical protein AMS68_007491 [Peltaster fructicola]
MGHDDMEPDGVEEFRDREYPQLKGKTYLDHGGTTLYARSLVEEFSHDLIHNLYGNPHSASKPSALAGQRVDAVRERALRFFNADPEEFDLVFVANATAAIKLVIDCFRDHAAASNTPVWYGYHKDSHTSLVGIREATKLHRCFTSDEEVDIWINSGGLGGPRARQLGLFAYPGQSNMTGRRLPLSWPGRIRKSFHKAPTYTLLDAAALASTAPLDLADPATAPDFVALSFYKIFGFPNIGALIVRKDSAHVLDSRRYFGGGTVDMVIAVNDTWHAKKETTVHDRLEDGTLPFHSIFALDHAINVHTRLYGPNPMKFISMHTAQLGKQLYDSLTSLRHSNGAPMCRIYKDDNSIYGDPSLQGATVAFNVMLADGTMLGYEEVEQAADERSIYVRSGSLCNPGGVATYLQWSPAEMRAAHAAGHRCSHPTQVMFGKATGVVRVSLGAMSVARDVSTFVKFLKQYYTDQTAQSKLRVEARVEALPTPTSAVSMTAPMSMAIPRSPGAASTHSLLPPKSAGSGHYSSADVIETLPAIEQPKPQLPQFKPEDYIAMTRSWKEEVRKQYPELKPEDASMYSRQINLTPSVKARKFGRSVVNLLRTKTHATEETRSPKTQNYSEQIDSALSQHSSRHSLEKAQFAHNVRALGL